MPLLRKLTALAGAATAARSYARKNPEKVNAMAAKAGRFVDQRTKGRYRGQIDTALRKVHGVTGRTPPPPPAY